MPGTRRRKVLNDPAATNHDRALSDDRGYGNQFLGFAPRIICGTTSFRRDFVTQMESNIHLKTFIQAWWVVWLKPLVEVWP